MNASTCSEETNFLFRFPMASGNASEKNQPWAWAGAGAARGITTQRRSGISAISMCAKRSPLQTQRCAARRQRLCVRRPTRPQIRRNRPRCGCGAPTRWQRSLAALPMSLPMSLPVVGSFPRLRYISGATSGQHRDRHRDRHRERHPELSPLSRALLGICFGE